MNKKLIFISIFFDKKYINLLYLLLESLYVYGNLDDDTNILIYTSTEFKNIIYNSNLYSNHIIFHINDNYNIINEAYTARLDLFDIKLVENYSKILYLDTDIIIISDINKIFDLLVDETVYAKKEGTVDNNFFDTNGQQINFWGNSFFTDDDIASYNDLSGFSSGVLLIPNNEQIKKIFLDIKNHILEDRKNNNEHKFYDQPYIVYHFKKNNMFNNIILDDYVVSDIGEMAKLNLLEESVKTIFNEKKYIINDDFFKTNINQKDTILHFNNWPGDYYHKNLIMTNKFYKIKSLNIQHIIDNAKKYMNNELIIYDENKKFEENVVNVLLNKNIKNILFNSIDNIFHLILMLFSNDKIIISYTYEIYSSHKKIIDLLEKEFTDRLFLEDININNYDLIYFDKINIFSNYISKLMRKTVIIYNSECECDVNDNGDDIDDIWFKYGNFKKITLNLHFTQKCYIKIFL